VKALTSRTFLTFVLAVGCASARQSGTMVDAPSTSTYSWASAGVIVADSAIAQAPVGRMAPRFPPEERARGVEAAFITAFILDTLGRVELPSISFLEDAPRAFAGAVCSYYRAARFAPARQNGAVSRALIVHPWTFGLSGGKWEHATIDAGPVRSKFQREGAVAAISELQSRPHCP